VVDEDDLAWSLASSAAAVAAVGLARRMLSRGWVAKRGKVPGNPVNGDTSWGEAMAWAAASGVVVGVVRLLAQRGVAELFQRQRGAVPKAASEKPV
jgi:hypothetical protein